MSQKKETIKKISENWILNETKDNNYTVKVEDKTLPSSPWMDVQESNNKSKEQENPYWYRDSVITGHWDTLTREVVEINTPVNLKEEDDGTVLMIMDDLVKHFVLKNNPGILEDSDEYLIAYDSVYDEIFQFRKNK